MIYIKSGKRQILDFKAESFCVPTVDYDLLSEQQSGIHTTKNDLHRTKFALRDTQHFNSVGAKKTIMFPLAFLLKALVYTFRGRLIAM